MFIFYFIFFYSLFIFYYFSIFRSANDQEAFLREIESELSKIERERRELGKSIKSWEAQFRIEQNRNPSNEDKVNNKEYSSEFEKIIVFNAYF